MFSIQLEHVTLTRFRCYPSLKLSFKDKTIVFTGPNGAGKTNILEAISFLNPGRGLRRSRLSEVGLSLSSTKSESASLRWAVSGRILLPQGEYQIGTALYEEVDQEKRLIRVNGKDISSQNELEKLLSVLWMTPAMDRLLSEGPSSRRRLIDKFASSLDPEHSKRLFRYEYALRERSRLLKEGRNEAVWISTLEEKLAMEGVAITVARQDILEHLMASMQAHGELFPRAFLSLDGCIETLLKNYSGLDTEEEFKKKLYEGRGQDRLSGGSSIGPHISDIHIVHIQKNIPVSLCSTGEQKVLLISMMLAHLRIHALKRKETPLLLLDEGLVHLDALRRQALFEELKRLNVQTFFTGTDLEVFSDLKGKAQFFEVESGEVKEKS